MQSLAGMGRRRVPPDRQAAADGLRDDHHGRGDRDLPAGKRVASLFDNPLVAGKEEPI